MGIENFQILLDNLTGIYYGGSVVSGKLKFYLDKPKKIRGVKIHFLGEANVSFRATRKTRSGNDSENKRVTFRGTEEYFSTKYYLAGSSNSEMEILPGEYEYPFTTTLPPLLPSSFESEHGDIQYLIKATVDIPWEFDDTVEKTFSIMTSVDLNNIAEAKIPVKQEVEKTFCCFWCRSGPLTMVLNLPYAGYVPGQNIPVILEVDNASDVDVDIVIKLQKIIDCKANVPETRTETEYTDLVELSLGCVNGNDSKTFTQQFSVPVVPVFSLHPCTIITCDYVFMVIAETGSCHSDLTAEVPIFLGTVPLYQAGGAPPPIDSSVPLQQSYNPAMPMTQPPFNPSMPAAQPPFNSTMPMVQPPFNPSMPMPQPMPLPQNPSEPLQMPSFNPPMPLPQPTFNPSMPLPQDALNTSNPSAEPPPNYLTPLLPQPVVPTAPPPTQVGWTQ